MLTNMLKLQRNERTDKDLRTIAQLLLDFKYFVYLGAERQQTEPYMIIDLAREIELVSFKPSTVVAKQEETQQKPLFLI